MGPQIMQPGYQQNAPPCGPPHHPAGVVVLPAQHHPQQHGFDHNQAMMQQHQRNHQEALRRQQQGQSVPQPVVSRQVSSQSPSPSNGDGSVHHIVIDWTRELDKSLQKLVHGYNKNWDAVGRSLNIHPEICRHRWTTLVQERHRRRRERQDSEQQTDKRGIIDVDKPSSKSQSGEGSARPDFASSSTVRAKRKQPEAETRQPASTHDKPDSPSKKRLREGFFFRVSRLLPGKMQENVGFLALPKDVTFAHARAKIQEDLDLDKKWAFYLSSLGPVSRKQESSLGTMVSWLSVKNKEDAGSRRNPIPVVIVDRP